MNKRKTTKIIIVGLLTLVIPYITIPALIIWWFYWKSNLSKRNKTLISLVIAGALVSLVSLGTIAYNKDTDPELVVSEPKSEVHVESNLITIKGSYKPTDRKVWVNGKQVVSENGEFEVVTEIKVGKNDIKISAGDWKRKTINLVVYRDLTEEEKQKIQTPTPTVKAIITNSVSATPSISQSPAQTITETSITEDVVRKEIEKISFGRAMSGKDIQIIEIIDNAGTEDIKDDKIIAITYSPKSVWDEKDIVKKTADTTVAVLEVLFKQEKISVVRIYTNSTFTDSYGKENTAYAVKIGLERHTAEKIDWVNFKNMVFVDYNKLLNIADYVWLHPSIKRSL